MIVAVVAIIYVALKMYDLTQFIENELRPILARVDDTLSTVQSRTTFISDAAVKPVIDVMSYTSSVKAIIRAFTRTPK
jgi:maltodextrin utilization protein YvdJ